MREALRAPATGPARGNESGGFGDSIAWTIGDQRWTRFDQLICISHSRALHSSILDMRRHFLITMHNVSWPSQTNALDYASERRRDYQPSKAVSANRLVSHGENVEEANAAEDKD